MNCLFGMDTLKSYFNKMKILPGHSHRSWKFGRKGSCGKNGTKGKYSRSKSQNDASFEYDDGTNGVRCVDPDAKENVLVKSASVAHDDYSTEPVKSPPMKPPRKDQIFTLEYLFSIEEQDNFGLVIGTTNVNSCHSDSIVSPLSQTIDLNSSMDEMSYQTISPIKVLDIQRGSIVEEDGRLQVHDEIMEVNHQSVHVDTPSSIR